MATAIDTPTQRFTGDEPRREQHAPAVQPLQIFFRRAEAADARGEPALREYHASRPPRKIGTSSSSGR